MASLFVYLGDKNGASKEHHDRTHATLYIDSSNIYNANTITVDPMKGSGKDFVPAETSTIRVTDKTGNILFNGDWNEFVKQLKK